MKFIQQYRPHCTIFIPFRGFRSSKRTATIKGKRKIWRGTRFPSHEGPHAGPHDGLSPVDEDGRAGHVAGVVPDEVQNSGGEVVLGVEPPQERHHLARGLLRLLLPHVKGIFVSQMQPASYRVHPDLMLADLHRR